MKSKIFSDNDSLALNYVKAFGIISVVLGHYPGNPFNLFNPYVYHMPLFFFLGGLLFKEDRKVSQTISLLTKKHIAYLLKTYIIIAFLIFLLNQAIDLPQTPMWRGGILESIKYPIEKNFHGGSYFLVAWFLFAYYLTSILFSMLNAINNRNPIKKITILIIISTFGFYGMNDIASLYHLKNNNYYNILSQTLVGVYFFGIGFLMKGVILKISGIYGVIISFTTLMLMNNYGVLKALGMAWSKYPTATIYQTISALMGIYFIFSIAKITASYKTSKLFENIGIKSRTIMSYHILVFLGLDLIFCAFGLYSVSEIGPTKNFTAPYTWPLYVFLGTLIPAISIKMKSLHDYIPVSSICSRWLNK